MRVRSSSDGVTIDRDVTANGNGSIVFDGSVAGRLERLRNDFTNIAI